MVKSSWQSRSGSAQEIELDDLPSRTVTAPIEYGCLEGCDAPETPLMSAGRHFQLELGVAERLVCYRVCAASLARAAPVRNRPAWEAMAYPDRAVPEAGGIILR